MRKPKTHSPRSETDNTTPEAILFLTQTENPAQTICLGTGKGTRQNGALLRLEAPKHKFDEGKAENV